MVDDRHKGINQLYSSLAQLFRLFSCESDSRDERCLSVCLFICNGILIKSHQDQLWSSINCIHQLTLITIHLFNFSSPLLRLLRLLVLLFIFDRQTFAALKLLLRLKTLSHYFNKRLFIKGVIEEIGGAEGRRCCIYWWVYVYLILYKLCISNLSVISLEYLYVFFIIMTLVMFY